MSGEFFPISSLTLGQVEQLFDPDEPLRPVEATTLALQNAGGSISADTLKQLLDIEEFETLYEAVLDASGLKSERRAPVPEMEQKTDFGAIRSHLVSALGWTFAQCMEAPFVYVQELLSYWRVFPPAATSLRYLLEAYTSWEPVRDRRWSGAQQQSSEKPISGVDYDIAARSFDNLPLSVQHFLHTIPKEQSDEPET